ncbi:helix-turn-helix transcriptional regulator [Haloactinomyces albus]|uniref:Tetratricopeptide (TPR) repeat protein n=1 Tax=Haloactinomyces albus TaxID=1352928 RepID=A0AAE4CR99_9ACTN|nr:helix-turn-helix transcriptional regulator [Haloactinomyces albus]MDR7303508.1 tetratricopeptide (TPR) repeat protein [Haloactinomyces albus]
MAHGDAQYCARCGARLARDNTTSLCSPCGHTGESNEAPRLSADFWNSDQMRDALASQDMGVVVRVYRRHPAHGRKPLPQSDVARWLNITQGQLSRIESGRNRVRDLDKLIHYARRLHIPAEMLWFDVGGTGFEPPKPSDVLRLPGGPVVPAAATRTEPVLAESLLMTLQQYVTTDNLAGPHSLLPIATQQASFAEQLLTESHGHGHAPLLYVAARFAEFTGWLYQDAGDLHTAMQWSNTALDLSQEAGDAHLSSYIRMRKSNIASDARKPDLTIAFARAALQNPGALPPRLKAVALRQEAHGYALAGNYDTCARALDHAFQYASEAPNDDTDIARYCTPSYIEMEAAHCWVELGKPAKALTTLQQGLADWQSDFRRDLGLCLARLAVAHAGTGQPNEALTVAQHSLAIASETRSHRTKHQLHRASELLTTVGAHEHAHYLRHVLRNTLR